MMFLNATVNTAALYDNFPDLATTWLNSKAKTAYTWSHPHTLIV
jgi:hypothetical protein